MSTSNSFERAQSKQPCISVIIPAYNREKSIERAIQSVLSQNYQEFEIVVVDDASSDGTKTVVADISAKDKRITYLRHEINKGGQAARNTGIKASNGDWITFLDSDDFLTEKSLESRMLLARKNSVSVVHSDCLFLKDDENLSLFGVSKISGFIYKSLLCSPGPIVFPGLLISREAIESIGFLDEDIKAYQEWDTVIRLSKHYEFAFLDEPTFVYDCRGNDTMSKNLLAGAEGYRQIFEKHFDDIVSEVGLHAVAEHYKGISFRYKLAGMNTAAAHYRVLSLLLWPFKLGDRIKNKVKSLFFHQF